MINLFLGAIIFFGYLITLAVIFSAIMLHFDDNFDMRDFLRTLPIVYLSVYLLIGLCYLLIILPLEWLGVFPS